LVPKDHQQEMACPVKKIGHVTIWYPWG